MPLPSGVIGVPLPREGVEEEDDVDGAGDGGIIW